MKKISVLLCLVLIFGICFFSGCTHEMVSLYIYKIPDLRILSFSLDSQMHLLFILLLINLDIRTHLIVQTHDVNK